MSVFEYRNKFCAGFRLEKGGKYYRVMFDTFAEAQAHEFQAKADHAVGKPYTPPTTGTTTKSPSLTMTELHDKCCKQVWVSPSCKDAKALASRAEMFVDWVGPKALPVDALTVSKVHDYVDYLTAERKNADATVNRQLCGISVMAEMAVLVGAIPAKPKLPWRKERKGRLRYYTHEEEAQMFGALASWGKDDWLDLFAFLVDTGMRLGDATRMPWGDIRGRSISVVGGKNDLDRGITATPRVEAVLRRMRLKYGTLRGPFHWYREGAARNLWARLRTHFDWMGDDTVIHTFRHTCASRLVIAGVDIRRVMEWMGHTRIETTMRYAHLAPKHLEGLADVLAKRDEAPPLLKAVS